MKQKKNAISLIKLVAIMLVIIVIGTAIVVLIADGLDIKGNKESKFKAMLDTYTQSLDSYIAKMYMQTSGSFNANSLSADLDSLEYNGVVREGNIFDILPTLKGSKYQEKITIHGGKFDVTAFKGKELAWAKEHLDNAITEELTEKEQIEKRQDLGEGTNIVEEAIVNKIPYVPDEFNHLAGTTVDNGYVIYDKYGNEYVWVPVEDTTIFEGKVPPSYKGYTDIVNEFNSIRSSIAVYGGFYIGRYEASMVNGKVSSVRNAEPLTNIKWGDSLSAPGANGAYSLAKGVSKSYGYNEFKSTLLYNSMWAVTVSYLEKDEDTNSLAYGNYKSSSFNVENDDAKGSKNNGRTYESIYSKSANTSVVLTTGATDRNCIKNIYDMAGNVSEWVVSPYDPDIHTVVVRGGDCSELSNAVSIRYAVEKDVASSAYNVGFRVALYL